MRHLGPVAAALAVALVLSGAALVAGMGLLAANSLPSDDGAGDSAVTQSPVIRDVIPASQPNLTGIHPIPVGETMLVRGVTNLRADQNVIFVEITRGPDADRFDTARVPPWGTDGFWSVRIDVPANTTPGNYTIRADDGFRVHSVETAFVDRPAAVGSDEQSGAAEVDGQADVTATPSTTPTTTGTATGTAPETPTTTATASATPTATATAPSTTPTATTTAPGQAGFTAALAALAILLLAVLRWRAVE